jgi:NADPH-dependent 2,4-dienoyl-CoA reductase/sulfur reductase-like enzyme
VNADPHVLVAGGGPAGITAALQARELGARVTLLEAGQIGGTRLSNGPGPGPHPGSHRARLNQGGPVCVSER